MAEEIIDGGGTGFNADGTPIETPIVPPVIVPPPSPKDDDMVAKLVQARIDAQLKPIKDKLDNASKLVTKLWLKSLLLRQRNVKLN